MKLFAATWIVLCGFAVVLRSYQGMPYHCAFDAACFVYWSVMYGKSSPDKLTVATHSDHASG